MVRTPGTNTFTGDLFRTTGTSLTQPWNPNALAVQAFGTATITFSDSNRGTFAYNVTSLTPAVSQTKEITRQSFGVPATVCRNAQ
jgi:hypothetical protein